MFRITPWVDLIFREVFPRNTIREIRKLARGRAIRIRSAFIAPCLGSVGRWRSAGTLTAVEPSLKHTLRYGACRRGRSAKSRWSLLWPPSDWMRVGAPEMVGALEVAGAGFMRGGATQGPCQIVVAKG